MSLQLIDVDITELHMQRSLRRTDAITQQLMSTISELEINQAKALIPDGGETLQQLRSKLRNASKIIGIKIRSVITDDERLVFALAKEETSGKANRIDMTARKDQFRNRAIELGQEEGSITAERILEVLADEDVTFDNVSRPSTMAAALLRHMPEFERSEDDNRLYIYTDETKS